VSALVVLLIGGGAATAARFIDGKRIKPGSVATKQLKNGAVTSAKLRKGAVGSGQLKNGSVTSAKLAPSAVVSGPTGPTGSAGPTGPAGPAGLSSVFTFRSTPNFLIPDVGGVGVFDQTLPLDSAAFVLNGSMKFVATATTPVTVECDILSFFRDSSAIQTGPTTTVAVPSGTMSSPSAAVTLPISGVAVTSGAPGDAVDLRVRSTCLATEPSPNVEVAEVVFAAVPVDQVNP
jgi:hypothetical protein